MVQPLWSIYLKIAVNVAAEIGSRKENIDFRVHWQNFLKTQKRCCRKLERSSRQVCYLENGVIKYIQVGKR
ncbi:hypothetical protein DP116_28355 [Brasilonema bromeliae SPC951]|uniref:Uncharacterized protein n=1 Tax=Brasilonema bromeliae SPC951 TaxID=385972 RepID=A0ABX1PGN2_9CYAN|nr:hypothetical protein [Brasilonema bromeliae SPC951]